MEGGNLPNEKRGEGPLNREHEGQRKLDYFAGVSQKRRENRGLL